MVKLVLESKALLLLASLKVCALKLVRCLRSILLELVSKGIKIIHVQVIASSLQLSRDVLRDVVEVVQIHIIIFIILFIFELIIIVILYGSS